MLEVTVGLRRGSFVLDAQFSCPTPGVVALFGASGAGKSTLVQALAGLIRPERGRIRLDARTWFDSETGRNVPAEQRRIGYVFQDARLFPHLSVGGNLEYAASRAPAGEPIAARAEVVALLGLGPLLGRRVHALSGGERQRVALARALLTQPDLLLLDEPLAAVDAARREEVLPYLESLRDRYAIPMLYVSHNYEEVLRLASYIVLLAEGTVAGCGTPGELGEHPALRRLIGSDAVGAVLEAKVTAIEADGGLASVSVGPAELRLTLRGVRVGARVRLNVLARDVILSLAAPQGLSVRNALKGTLTELIDEGADAVLATVSLGNVRLYSRISRAAVHELKLAVGQDIWALVKAASLRGHAFAQAAATDR